MTASEHRSRAREALKGNWPLAALITLIASLLGGTSTGGNSRINIDLESLESLSLESLLPGWANSLIAIFGMALAAFALIAIVIGIVLAIIGCPIKLGYHRYALDLLDRRETGVSVLFSQFNRLGTAVVMNLVRGVAIFFGTLLFVVPGIILNYSFSMADFILLEDPDCSATEALSRSSAMMKGHKWELFVLELTFIGWSILAGFTFGIGGLFLTPYMLTARASFYRNLRNGGSPVIDSGYITVE